jgi:mRNA interferase MazF
MAIKQGEIVLIPVPFTDLSSSKRRPVIVISQTAYHQQHHDMLVVAMTSQPLPTPYGFSITQADMVEGHLQRPGQVRVDKMYTLTQGLIVRRFGQVQPVIIERIRKLFLTLTHP